MLCRLAHACVLLGLGLALTGCAASRDQTTFRSTHDQPKSVSVIDTTTGETLWAMDVPVGQELELEVIREEGARGKNLLQASNQPPTSMSWTLYAVKDDDEALRSNTIDLPGRPVRLSYSLREAGARPRAMLREPQATDSPPPGTQPEPEPMESPATQPDAQAEPSMEQDNPSGEADDQPWEDEGQSESQ
jgi:hypothetical protein